ncbi:MAG: protein kinase [Myxococcales bacterium]|nr:protein kinase [Myxococcales bacterium]
MGVPQEIGRYVLFAELASGGMATVHLGRLKGQAGFARTVAIKRSHPGFARDPEFVSMFLDEARIAARIRHPNVVSVLDVEARDGELFLVMDYIHGESLARLWKLSAGSPVPPGIAGRIVADVLYGLHAAHQARNERGEPLQVVHRDVSPQNVLVGADGTARVTDFGIAKAVNRIQTTHEGQLKGKLSYMAAEQLEEKHVDARTDVYAASVVFWELLTARRLHTSADAGATITRILSGNVHPPSRLVPDIPPEIEAIVMRGLAREIDDRFASAQDMAVALERAMRLALPAEVADWVDSLAHDSLAERARVVGELETSDTGLDSREDGSARAHELARAATASFAELEPPTEPLGFGQKSIPDTGSGALAGELGSKSNANVAHSLVPPPSPVKRLGWLSAVLVVVAGVLVVTVVFVWRAGPGTAPAASTPGLTAPANAPREVATPSAAPSVSTPVTALTEITDGAPAGSAEAVPAAENTAKRPSRGRPMSPASTPAAQKKPTFGSLSRE